MGNANENVKKIAEYEVADCDHDGVAEAIERFCLD
jgi:hydroxymethylpyrimidine pyrophosphatase-like HAD family hydrolase